MNSEQYMGSKIKILDKGVYAPNLRDVAVLESLKVALDTCSHYACINSKSMHELRRSRPTTNETFTRIFFSKLFVLLITRNCSHRCAQRVGTQRIIINRFTALNKAHVLVNIIDSVGLRNGKP